MSHRCRTGAPIPGEVIYSPEQAAGVCSYYQEALRLRDWIVEVRIVPLSEMPSGIQARVDWNLLRKSAVIRLLRPLDFRRRREFSGAQDMELDIVHELCHLHLAPLGVESGTPEDTAQEQAIEALSQAYVALVRGRRK